MPLSRVHKHARVHGHLPLPAHLRVHLAHPSLPTQLLALDIAPQGVYVHHRERPVPLLGDLDLLSFPHVSYELVRVEEFLPSTEPPLTIVAAPLEGPLHGVVGGGGLGPRPDHVRVEDAEQQLRVFGVPGPRLPVYYLPHLGCRVLVRAILLLGLRRSCFPASVASYVIHSSA